MGENGGQESGRFAGAGLGPACGILARQGMGQDLTLDGGAVRKAQIGDGMYDLVGKVKVVKTGFALDLGNEKLCCIPRRGWDGFGKPCCTRTEIVRDMGRLGHLFFALPWGGALRFPGDDLFLWMRGGGKVAVFCPTSDDFF